MIKIILYNGGPDFGKASLIHLETFPYFETEEMLPSTEYTISLRAKVNCPYLGVTQCGYLIQDVGVLFKHKVW